MINLFFALVAEAVAPIPARVVSDSRDDVLSVQMPRRAIAVAATLALACGAIVFHALPTLLQLVVDLFAWAQSSRAPHVGLPRACWAVLETAVGCAGGLRFLGLYARWLARVASPTADERTIRYTIGDPRG